MQVRASGRASRRPGEIGWPQVSHSPYRPLVSLVRAPSISSRCRCA